MVNVDESVNSIATYVPGPKTARSRLHYSNTNTDAHEWLYERQTPAMGHRKNPQVDDQQVLASIFMLDSQSDAMDAGIPQDLCKLQSSCRNCSNFSADSLVM
jgi:hypothetical protein